MCDGSTDSAVLEQELVYVRYINGGIPVNKYLSIVTLKAGDAADIYDGIDAAFELAGFNPAEWREQIVGFGADGAAVIFGKRQGVATLLKKDVPHVVEVYCVAHRLELGILDAMKEEK